MSENERIVCEFLRKIAPSREWEYLAEVEHCWIGELCDKLNKSPKAENDTLEAENEKLREVFLEIANMIGKKLNLHDLEEKANLQLENERLRKLILDIWNDAIRFDDFWDYVMDDGELYNVDELPHYQERMKELGIKVN